MNSTVSSYKIIHLPTTVGGNPQGLSRAMCVNGLDSYTLAFTQNYFAYSVDKTIFDEDDSLIAREFKKICSLSYLFKNDVVFFNFGRTLFSPDLNRKKPSGITKKILHIIYGLYISMMFRFETFMLKFLKRVVFIQYQGDDARQGDYCLSNFDVTTATQVAPEYYSNESDLRKKQQLLFMDGLCDRIYALNPDLLHVLPSRAEFLPYCHVSMDEWFPVFTQKSDRPLRIGHAPSHRAVKGTSLIEQAVSSLKAEGYDFEFVLIEGMSNHEAKELYKTIDVMVDQLFAGWYGGLAVEAMALGKPVIAYIRQNDLHFIPEKMRKDLPIINAAPDTIYEVLKNVLNMTRDQLLLLAQKSRAYVEEWHNPITIARKIEKDLNDVLRGAQ